MELARESVTTATARLIVATAAFSMPPAREMVAFVVLLVVCGIAWYFVQDKVAEPFKSAAIVAVCLFFALALLHWAGLF